MRDLISHSIYNLLSKKVAVYLPRIGTLSVSGGKGRATTLEFSKENRGTDIIDVLSKEADIKEIAKAYEHWIEDDSTISEDFVEYNIEGVGQIRLYEDSASVAIADKLYNTLNTRKHNAADNAIAVALAAAESAPSDEYSLVADETTDPNEDSVDISTKNDTVMNEKEKEIGWKTIAIILAVLLFIVAVFSSYYLGIKLNSKEKIIEVVKDTVYVTPAAELTPSKEALSTGKFNLIAGSFLEKQKAEKLAEKYILEGYNATVFFSQEKGYHMVSVFSSDDRKEVQKKLNSLNDYESNMSSQFWIYEY